MKTTPAQLNNGYVHFLTYDQYAMIAYVGHTHLYYRIDDEQVRILKEDEDHAAISGFERSEYPAETREALKSWLVDFLSRPGAFIGEPVYVQSLLFSEADFGACKRMAGDIIDERMRKARLISSEIVDICRRSGLSPEPTGDNETNWTARCPSGGSHSIMISTMSNQWGCGYCRRKGDAGDLLSWLKEKGKA
jgi:hypothetical protein